MDKIKILVADDHTLIRQAWKLIINADKRLKVILESGNCEATIRLAKEHEPDIILMDINMPGIGGIEATRLITNSTPTTKIIGVSSHVQPAFAKQIMKMGALGYVTKSSTKEELIDAILTVHNNGKYICEEMKNNIADEIFDDSKQIINSLTYSEIELINLLKQGYTAKDIAKQLSISESGVEARRARLMQKLKVKNKVALLHLINHNSI